MDKTKISLFEGKKIRRHWNTKEEGSQVVTKCDQLKMLASDGKYYLTDAADVEALFRIIQSVPSPKAEPMSNFHFSLFNFQ